MKLETFIFLLLLTTASAYKITNFSCDCTEIAEEQYVYPNYSCNYFNGKDSEASSTFDVHFDFQKPIIELWLEGKTERKIDDDYVHNFNISKMEVCSRFSLVSFNMDSSFTTAYYAANEAMPNVVHRCPYTEIHARRVTIDTKFIPIELMTGEFRVILKTFSGDDELEPLCTITAEFNI